MTGSWSVSQPTIPSLIPSFTVNGGAFEVLRGNYSDLMLSRNEDESNSQSRYLGILSPRKTPRTRSHEQIPIPSAHDRRSMPSSFTYKRTNDAKAFLWKTHVMMISPVSSSRRGTFLPLFYSFTLAVPPLPSTRITELLRLRRFYFVYTSDDERGGRASERVRLGRLARTSGTRINTYNWRQCGRYQVPVDRGPTDHSAFDLQAPFLLFQPATRPCHNTSHHNVPPSHPRRTSYPHPPSIDPTNPSRNLDHSVRSISLVQAHHDGSIEPTCEDPYDAFTLGFGRR